MKIASVADVKAHFSAYLRASEKGPVVVTSNGKPAAAVLLAVGDDDELERLLMAHSAQLQEILAAARRPIGAGAGIHDDQFWKDVAGVKETKKPARRRSRPA